VRRGAGPTLAAALRQAIADQERTLLDAGLGFSKVDRAFRRAIVAAKGNAILLRQYDAPRDRQQRISVTTVGHDPARIGRFIAEHREIAAALERGDGDEAAVLIDCHLPACAGIRSAITPLTGRPGSPSSSCRERGSSAWSYQRTAWRLIRSRRA
jgi:DNA-binding GntR family transcriptional regulator